MNNKKNKLSIGTENIISLKDFEDKLNKTKKIFPKVGLIYSASRYFEPEIYEQVIMSYNNPKLTELLAKFVDYIFDSYQPETKRLQPVKDMILDFIGAGITDNELSKYKAFQHKPRNGHRSKICRMAPNGLHPHAIAQKHGYKDRGYIGTDLLPHAFLWLLYEHGDALRAVVDAYIRGDQQAMLDAMPEKLSKVLLFQQEYKTSNMPVDELNIAGKWLKDNMNIAR